MKINRGREQGRPSEHRGPTFTGSVWADPVLADPEGGVNVGSVFFEPRSRTFWHSHGNGQILHVTHGHGRVRARDGSGGTVAAGDVVYSPAGEEHWHGAGPDSYLLHHAISLGPTTWLEEVTDEEYNKGF